MRINHNISAQLANASLKKIDNRLASSLERLSTGYKINHAADDASGLAISNRMRTQIRALDQASRNAADGDSIIQTAEGALSEIESILQRIRELGVEAANDTLTLDDRKAVQDEIDQLLDEVDRISETTEFNGKGLLDGSAARTTMSNTLSVRALSASMQVTAGTYDVTVTTLAESATAALDYTIPTTGTEIILLNGTEIEITSQDDDTSVKAKVLNVCDAMNIDVEGGAGTFQLTSRTTGSAQKIEIKYPANPANDVYETGIDAEIAMGDGFKPADSFSYTAVGANITIVGNGGFEMQIDTAKAAVDDQATLRVEDAGYMVLQIGANEHQTLEMDFTEVSCERLCLRDSAGSDLINACSQDGAEHLINVLDQAINNVSAARSALGAYQNRLDATQNSLDVSSENLTDAMSRIKDTDMAEEMTEYTQQNVLSQAATSMLSQANNRPQTVMSLLQS